ncbi:MAG: hypothetical protein KatS3mg102_0706 [Planctomycetota bacterium]|nr:MAG: hypothetical protein KatS3mg102_0706 [Planctomycetota bacterium]
MHHQQSCQRVLGPARQVQQRDQRAVVGRDLGDEESISRRAVVFVTACHPAGPQVGERQKAENGEGGGAKHDQTEPARHHPRGRCRSDRDPAQAHEPLEFGGRAHGSELLGVLAVCGRVVGRRGRAPRHLFRAHCLPPVLGTSVSFVSPGTVRSRFVGIAPTPTTCGCGASSPQPASGVRARSASRIRHPPDRGDRAGRGLPGSAPGGGSSSTARRIVGRGFMGINLALQSLCLPLRGAFRRCARIAVVPQRGSACRSGRLAPSGAAAFRSQKRILFPFAAPSVR